MENLAVARVLREIADLLELKGENPFRIRAYRNAADAVADATVRVADLAPAELVQIPGIGRDLAAKIRELAETGRIAFHDALAAEFPPTLLDLLSLQGVGARTVAALYHTFGIATLDDLEAAARAGRLRTVRGFGPRKEQALLQAIEAHRGQASRHLVAEAREVADALVEALLPHAGGASIDLVGSLRRGTDTIGDLDLLAAGAPPSLMDAFVGYRLVERVLARGETKSSVQLWKGFQADLRIVPLESRGAALQYFTGSKAHNIALRDRAIGRGFKLNEYGLFRLDDGVALAGATEEGLYEALGLAWVPPELRENRGEIEAAESGRLPRLVTRADLRGDVHAHTPESDGRDPIETLVDAARRAGLTYLAITDHSKSLAMANGLDESRALAHAARIRALNDRLDGFTLLAGIECDIRPDGTLDLAPDCLAELDYVVASIHSAFSQDEAQMTDRVLRALECPWVDTLGHPTGRLLLRRQPYRINLSAVFDAAAKYGVALEINSLVDRLDLNEIAARAARDRGVRIVVASDAHSGRAFDTLRWGIQVARRAWLEPDDILNTRPVDAFRASLRRNRHD